MRHLVLLVLVLVALVGCTEELGAIDLDAANNGTTLDITTGQVISIHLESNITTGYKWNLVTPPDPRVLKLLSSTYNEPTPGRAGASGSETWQFQAVGRGTTSLKLAYARPFESNTPPAKEFSITVTVQ